MIEIGKRVMISFCWRQFGLLLNITFDEVNKMVILRGPFVILYIDCGKLED